MLKLCACVCEVLLHRGRSLDLLFELACCRLGLVLIVIVVAVVAATKMYPCCVRVRCSGAPACVRCVLQCGINKKKGHCRDGNLNNPHPDGIQEAAHASESMASTFVPRNAARSHWNSDSAGLCLDAKSRIDPWLPIRETGTGLTLGLTMTMTMTHSEKVNQHESAAWPYKHECKGHNTAKKNC